jgi:hypothetical protein
MSRVEEIRKPVDAALATLASEIRTSREVEDNARARVSALEIAVDQMAQAVAADLAGSGNGIDYLVYQWHIRRSALDKAKTAYSEAQKHTASLLISEQLLVQRRNVMQ